VPTIQTKMFSDRRSLLYDKSVSFMCDGRLFIHSAGPAAANALSPKVPCVCMLVAGDDVV